jgi:hypothetical protein
MELDKAIYVTIPHESSQISVNRPNLVTLISDARNFSWYKNSISNSFGTNNLERFLRSFENSSLDVQGPMI